MPATAIASGRNFGIDPEEWEARVDLAACYRLVAHYGMDQLSAAMLRRVKRVRVTDPLERARRRLREVGKAYVEYALAEPGLFAVAFNPITLGDLSGPYQQLTDALDDCVEAGFMRPEKRPGAALLGRRARILDALRHRTHARRAASAARRRPGPAARPDRRLAARLRSVVPDPRS